ncbi:hypothetical protein V8D89_002069 [Ganoderma adspersum]
MRETGKSYSGATLVREGSGQTLFVVQKILRAVTEEEHSSRSPIPNGSDHVESVDDEGRGGGHDARLYLRHTPPF